MKKKIGSLLIAFMMVMTMVPSLAFAETTSPDGIPITEENFPDKELRKVLKEIEKTTGEWYEFDSSSGVYFYGNGNGVLESDELNSLDCLVFSENQKITNLKGLEYLQSLEELEIKNGSLSSISNLPISLKNLTLKNCNLTSLDVSHLTNLETLDVRYNNISSREKITGFEAEEYDEDYYYSGNYEGIYKYIRYYPQGSYKTVSIDESHFPDKAFRDYVLTEIDYNDDGMLSTSEIENTSYIYAYDEGIQSLEGLKYFPYLESLNCSDNFLTELSDLPEYLTDLYCDDNLLSELPQLPDGLEELSCSGNKLTNLPKLPDSLISLYCYNNSLESLPQLSKSLKDLDCSENKLTSLPSLSHTSITDLNCSENKISVMPDLPATMKILNCGSNELNKLPALPKTIKELWASNNKLEGILDISQQAFLNTVYLQENILTGLIVSDKAKYECVDLGYNYMASKNAVSGRDDIDWDNVFYFGDQKTYCDVYGHNLSKNEISKAYVNQSYTYEGCKYKVCSECGYDTWFEDECEVIPAVKRIKLSSDVYTYNGKSKKPTVTVYDSNGKKISSQNYSVSYASGRKNVGKYKVTVKFKGDYYEGSRYVTFKINPKSTTISSISKGKKSFTVKWKKQSGKMAKSRITGYQYRYSTSSKMTSPKTVTVKGYSKTSAKKTGLKAKQKYYVQVRTYKTVDGVKYYSSWSKAKSVKTK